MSEEEDGPDGSILVKKLAWRSPSKPSVIICTLMNVNLFYRLFACACLILQICFNYRAKSTHFIT